MVGPVATSGPAADPGEDTRRCTVPAQGGPDQAGGREPSPAAAFLRGIAAVFLVRGLLSLITGLLRKRKFKQTLRVVFSLDVVRQAGFFGSYAGLFTLIRSRLAFHLASSPRLRSNPALVDGLAGGLAGVSIMVDMPARRGELAQYLLSRAAALVCTSGARKGLLPTVPHFGGFVFALCQIPIMSGFLFMPDAMNPDYSKLILKWSRDITDGAMVKAFRNAPCTDHVLSCEEAGYHQGACVPYLAEDLCRNWWITAKMYIPLYCIPRLTLSLKRTLETPWETGKRTAKDIFFSGMMLATYIFAIKSAMCSYRHGMGHREGRVALWLGGIGGLATGTGVLWESPSRQRELAIYVVPQALTTVWNMAKLAKWVRPVPGHDVLMFGTAMSVIMYHLKRHCDDVKPFIRTPLERIITGPLLAGKAGGAARSPTPKAAAGPGGVRRAADKRE